MKKVAAILSTLVILTTPALAYDIEEIGTIEANFGGEAIVQPTVLARDGDEASATAFLILPGGGMSNLSLAGYSLDNKRLGLDASYMTEQPGPQTAPIAVTITYAPRGTKEHWTSDDAPTPPNITFTTLAVEGEEGRAVATFKALLCYAEDHDSGPDTGNCRPIEGSFDTRFTVEK